MPHWALIFGPNTNGDTLIKERPPEEDEQKCLRQFFEDCGVLWLANRLGNDFYAIELNLGNLIPPNLKHGVGKAVLEMNPKVFWGDSSDVQPREAHMLTNFPPLATNLGIARRIKAALFITTYLDQGMRTRYENQYQLFRLQLPFPKIKSYRGDSEVDPFDYIRFNEINIYDNSTLYDLKCFSSGIFRWLDDRWLSLNPLYEKFRSDVLGLPVEIRQQGEFLWNYLFIEPLKPTIQ